MTNTIKVGGKNLIVIAGCQRSGTTLLGQILGSHDRTFLVDEADGLYKWFEAWINRLTCSNKLFLSTIKKASKKYTDIRSQFTSIDDLSGYKMVLKAPNLTFAYSEMALLSPKPITVFVIRDVRGVVASMLKLPHIIDRQICFFLKNELILKTYHQELVLIKNSKVPLHIKAAIIWKVKNKLFHEFSNKGLEPLLVNYEKLVDVDTLLYEQLVSHCNLGSSQSLMNHHKLMTGHGPGNTSRNRKIDSISLFKWKKELTEKEIEEIVWYSTSI